MPARNKTKSKSTLIMAIILCRFNTLYAMRRCPLQQSVIRSVSADTWRNSAKLSTLALLLLLLLLSTFNIINHQKMKNFLFIFLAHKNILECALLLIILKTFSSSSLATHFYLLPKIGCFITSAVIWHGGNAASIYFGQIWRIRCFAKCRKWEFNESYKTNCNCLTQKKIITIIVVRY